jgi:hypothetical protein
MIKNHFLLILSLMLVTTVFSGCLEDSDDSSDTETDTEYYPPVLIISDPKHNNLVEGTIDITVSIQPERPMMEFTYYIDDVLVESSYQPGFSWDTTGVENGKHIITVHALEIGTDVLEGTLPQQRSVTVRVNNEPEYEPEENIPPTITMNAPAGDVNGYYRGPVTIRGEAEDAESDLDSIEMKFNDWGDWFDVPLDSRNRWQYTIDDETVSAEIDIFVRAFDGEDHSEILKQTILLDNHAPDITFLQPDEGETCSGMMTMEVEVDDTPFWDELLIGFAIDTTVIQTSDLTTCEIDTTEFENGDYFLHVGVIDAAGNEATLSREFTIHNNHAPQADIKSPIENEVFEEGEIITFDGSYSQDEDGDELTYLWESSIDGTIGTTQIFDSGLSVGDHSLSLTVEDTHGETSGLSIYISVYEHENQYPEVTIETPEDDALIRGEVTVSGQAIDHDGEITELAYRTDDGNWTRFDPAADWSFQFDTTELLDGDHTMDVLVTDNEDASANDRIDFTIDNTGPAVKIINPTNPYVRQIVDIEVEVQDDGSEIEWIRFDIKNETVQQGQETTYSWDTTGEEDGPEYNVEVVVRDGAGNEDNDTIILQVDNTPPEFQGMSPAEGSFVSGNVTLEPDTHDEGSGVDRFVFKLGTEVVKDSTSSIYLWNTHASPDGEHTFEIIIYDRAGNEARESFTFFVDNTPPNVEITDPADGTKIDGDGIISVDAEDVNLGSGMATVRFFFNGLIQATDTEKPFEFSFHSDDYADGDYRVTVIAMDNAGNARQTSIDIRLGDVPEPIITNPGTNYLSRYDVAGVERLIFDDYQAVPIVSSQVKHRGVMPSVNWDGAENPKDSLTISMPAGTGYAGYAGNIALSYWNNPEKAIVVDSYQHAVMMSGYASLMNYPIVLYESSNPKISDEALYKLDTTFANQIIVLGNTPYNNQGVTVFQESDLLDEQIGAAQFTGITMDYITVVNPDDIPSNSNTAYLSAFAGVFASHHDGLILPCPSNSNQMNTIIHNAIDALAVAGMPAEHICIVGDHISLPMGKDGGTPGDNIYGDLDGNKYTIEISLGRVLAKELEDISYYVDRIVNYEDYLAIQIGTPPLRMLDPFNWNNNAMIYMGWLAEFAEDSENHCREYLWALGRFNTQDDTDKAHAGLGTTVMMEDVARSNYFIINADHGEPTGTMTWRSEDLPEMNPGITFGVSCSLGRLDGVNKQASVTYTMMEQGMNVYLAPTRTAYGMFVQTYPYQPVAAPGLCYLYLRYMIDNDYDSGTAYMHAKNDLIENSYAGNVDNITTWQYQHFGDPGFNPYEPNNEGSLF